MTDSNPGSDVDTDTGPSLAGSVRDLHAHLEATAEYPVTETANRWLGEAEVIAADAVSLIEAIDSDADTPLDAIETRIEQIRTLLVEVDETGSAEADDHVRMVRDLTYEVLAELSDDP